MRFQDDDRRGLDPDGGRAEEGDERPRRRGRRRWAAAGLAAMLVVGAVHAPAAPGQSIEGLRGEAAAIEAELTQTRERLVELAEEHNRAGADLARAEEELTAAQASLTATREEYEARRGELREYALRAYVDGGSLRDLDGLLGTDVNDVERRRSYLSSAVGNRQALIDRLTAAAADVERRITDVEEARAEADGLLRAAEAAKAEAQALEADLAALLERTQGRLAELVAEAEARRLAEEQRAAEERAAAERRAAEERAARESSSSGATAAPPAPPAPAPVPTSAPAPRPTATTTAAPAPAPAAPASRPEAAAAVAAAMSQIGVPYVWAGASPSQGFDCSGLMMWAWAQAGRSIPRPADYQRDAAIPLTYEQLEPGDLVFYGEPVSHVAMYIGNDTIVNAPYTGQLVRTQTMWYSSRPMTYGRVR